ncbi:MAG: Flp pilus assembly protein CpaB [Anaerolineales bacterium]
MKKVLPIVLAVVVFLAAIVLLRPASSKTVVVAAHDLRAGHTLADSDLVTQAMPANAIAADAITDIKQALGQTLRIDRGQGDVIRTSNLGGMITLQPDERAVAVKITDATGLVGLLVPGQKVGIVASIQMQGSDSQGIFSKSAIEGLRVMYVDPRFSAADTTTSDLQTVGTPTAASGLSSVNGMGSATDRAQTGFVILAVPTSLETILYDFSANNSISQSRQVNVLELLAALGASDSTSTITLYLMPGENAKQFTSPGLWLPGLVITPQATPTGTPSAPGAVTTVVPQPTPTR